MLGFNPLSNLPLSSEYASPILLGSASTSGVGDLSDKALVEPNFLGLFGIGHAGILDGFSTDVNPLGAFGTGHIGTFVEFADVHPLGVHGNGHSGNALRVATTLGIFTDAVVENLIDDVQIDKTPLGIHSDAVVNILFAQLVSQQIFREVFNTKINPLHVAQFVRESFLTEHSGTAIIHVAQLSREVSTLNPDAIIHADQVLREIILLNANSDKKIRANQTIREVVATETQEVKVAVVVRELLMETTPKNNPSVVLIVT
jgi:hypothetical protein